MKISISSSPLSSGHVTRGTGVYTKNLIEAIQKYESDHIVTLFSEGEEIPGDSDVVHYPFFDPYFLTLPLAKPKPTVVTVHDVIPLVFPDKFPAGIRGTIKWQVQKMSLLGASAVLTDSQASKRDIARIVDISQEDVFVVPLAPAPQYSTEIGTDDIEKAKEKYHLPKHYVLYVGDVNWNKNILGLIEAWGKFVTMWKGSELPRLVLLGSAFTNEMLPETKEIFRQLHSLGIKDTVQMPGHIEDEDMAACYSGSLLTVLPSMYEGFGFPVLEAMMCNVPVIASNASSIPEISGPSPLFNPSDPNEIANAIESVLLYSPMKRRTLVEKGRAWARTFTWEKVAHETIMVYEKALKKAL
jgi:glycosyltransferase involved in cell wall biosynthesis